MKRGQLSAEMLILLVLILALVAIVYTQLTKTVNTASGNMDVKTWDTTHVNNACPSGTDTECTGSTQGSQLKCDTTLANGPHCVYK